jgi:hypothetical protein
MMEARFFFETLVNFYKTAGPKNSEVSHLHTHLCENLKFQRFVPVRIDHFVKRYERSGGKIHAFLTQAVDK